MILQPIKKSIYILGILLLAACGETPVTKIAESATSVQASPEVIATEPSATNATESTTSEQRYPEILNAELSANADGSYDLSVTISSPYDTPARYADGWRVRDSKGNIVGEHTLSHNHATEQPFTRVQRNLIIPAESSTIVIEGRDSEYGYGGMLFSLPVQRP